MYTWLRKHFVPHEGNDHRPHFLHNKNTQRVLVLVLALEFLVFVLPMLTFVKRADNTNLAAVLPSVLALNTNTERVQNNVPALTVSPLLTVAAELKAQDMAEKGYFAHTSPEGKTPWYWLQKVGYKYDYAGENLAINFSDSQDVTNAWMDSPTHRSNIVKSTYSEIGTGVATGIYKGRKTIFVAQLYANPRASTAVAMTPAPDVVAQSNPAQSGPQTDVLGAEVAPAPVKTEALTPSMADKISASPRKSADVIFLILLGITVAALVLNIVIKMKVQHPDLITNGLLVIVVIATILIVNNFIGTKDLVISQGLDYSHEETVQ
jgi:hypothetical protein